MRDQWGGQAMQMMHAHEYGHLHDRLKGDYLENNTADPIVSYSDDTQCRHFGRGETARGVGKQVGQDAFQTKLAAKYEARLRKKKIRRHWDEFIQKVTCHGFHYLFDNEYRLRRIIWFLLVVGSVAFLLQKLYESTSKFFAFPFSTTSTIIYEEFMDFPAVSICNQNDLRKSKMAGTNLDRLLADISIGKETMHTMAGKISGEEYRHTTKEANHQLQDMLIACTVLGQTCTYLNFTGFYQTQGEQCYTYVPTDRVKQTGSKNGMSFTLNTEHYDYYSGLEEAGLRLIIHEKDETPVRMQGISLAPGFTTFVQVEKRKTVNLPRPYATMCGSTSLKYFENYSEHACWLESLTDHIVSQCHCKDSFMPGSHRVCSLQELINCTWPQWEIFKTLEYKGCPLACEITTFSPLLSFAQFPSNQHADELAKRWNLSGSPLENRLFIRDNMLQVKIYYEQLQYVQMKQEPSYDLMVLLGDLGGQLGLFLGTSILTYVEFFDCLVMVIYTKYFEIFKIRTNFMHDRQP